MVEIASTMEHCWIHWPMMTVREGVHRKSSAGGGCDESENEALVLGLERVTVEEDGEGAHRGGRHSGWYNGRNWFPLSDVGREVLKAKDNAKSTRFCSCTTLSMQYAFRLADFPSALAAFVGAAADSNHAGRVVEVKFLGGSPATLLGINRGDTVACINFWWQIVGTPSVRQAASQLDLVERAMQAFSGRPHWGKLHRCTREYLHAVAPGLELLSAWNAISCRCRQTDRDLFSVL